MDGNKTWLYTLTHKLKMMTLELVRVANMSTSDRTILWVADFFMQLIVNRKIDQYKLSLDRSLDVPVQIYMSRRET